MTAPRKAEYCKAARVLLKLDKNASSSSRLSISFTRVCGCTSRFVFLVRTASRPTFSCTLVEEVRPCGCSCFPTPTVEAYREDVLVQCDFSRCEAVHQIANNVNFGTTSEASRTWSYLIAE
jgi:hypothetical protein